MKKTKTKQHTKDRDTPPKAPGKEAPADNKTEPAVAAGKQKQKQEPSPQEESLQTQLLRLRADFDNYRKRVQRERSETYQRANEDLITELLSVVDHFEMGLQTAQQHHTDPAVVNGLQLVYDQLMAALGKFGLTPIEAEGAVFDPHLHEAATHIASEEHPADTVIAQTRRGYKLGDRLLRAAQVVVSSGPAEPPADSQQQQDS